MDDPSDSVVLICQRCGEEFILTGEAREFLRKRGFTEVPRWCRACFHKAKRAEKKRHYVTGEASGRR